MTQQVLDLDELLSLHPDLGVEAWHELPHLWFTHDALVGCDLVVLRLAPGTAVVVATADDGAVVFAVVVCVVGRRRRRRRGLVA